MNTRLNTNYHFPIEGAEGDETEEQKTAREAAEAAAAKEAADKAAKDKADAEAAEKAKADAEAKAIADEKAQLEKDRKDGKLTDKEFELLTDAMKHKQAAKDAKKAAEELEAKLKTFEGIDPKAVKDLVKKQEAAEKAAREAELKAAEQAGDVERIKKMMGDEHEKVVKAIKDAAKQEAADLKKQLKDSQALIGDLTVGVDFANSKFVNDELVLPPAIAREVYSPYFDVVNGVSVPFDKKRGESGRTQMVDASGKALPFEQALRKIIESSPDKDRMIRSKLKPGAGSHTDRTSDGDNKTAPTNNGVSIIANALNKGALKPAE